MGVGSRTGGLAGGGGVPIVVVGNQTPQDNLVIPSDALDTRTFIELIDPGGLGDMARGGQIGTFAAVTGFQNVLPAGTFTSGAIALADTNSRTLQLTAEAWLRVAEQQIPAAEDNVNNVIWSNVRAVASATGAWTRSSPTALIGTAGINLKASAGRMRMIQAHNTGAAAWFLQVHDDAAAPVNADNSIARRIVAPGATEVIDFGSEGVYLPTGVSYAISTTVVALTLIAALEAAIMVEYL